MPWTPVVTPVLSIGICLEVPKSDTFGVRQSSSKILSVFMSLCTIDIDEDECKYVRAFATATAMLRRSLQLSA